MSKYLVQKHFETSLRSHVADMNFICQGASVKFLQSGNTELLQNAQVIVNADNYNDASEKAEDILTELFDACALVMKSSVFSMSIDFIMKNECGQNERIILRHIHSEERPGLFLMHDSINAIQELLDEKGTRNCELSLRWLRYSYRNRPILEEFYYLWLALERLIGEKEIISRCKECGVKNPHSGVPKDEILALVQKHNRGYTESNLRQLWKARQKVFHGGDKPTHELLLYLKAVGPIIRKTIEEELYERIRPSKRIKIAMPVSEKRKETLFAPIRFLTRTPEKEFVDDYPSLEQSKELVEMWLATRDNDLPKLIDWNEFRKSNW